MQDIYILGSGAMGCLWASYFPSQYTLHFIQRHPSEDQFQFQVLPYATQHTVMCHKACDLNTPIERLILATKAYDALPAMESIAHLLSADTQVILLQNGLGSQQAIAQAFPHVALFACSSTEGAYKQNASTLVHAGKGHNLIGPMNNNATQALLATWLPSNHYEWRDDINPVLWRKFMINCAINPLTVLYQCQNGVLLQETRYLSHMQRICEELDLLSAAQHFEVEAAFNAAKNVCELTAQNYSSMLQDHKKGNRTEIDYMTGYLLQLAHEFNIPCPANTEVYQSLVNLG